MKQTAVVMTHGLLRTERAKTAHGLIRGSDRFEVVGIIDPQDAGQDAGELLDGRARNLPVYGSLEAFLHTSPRKASHCIIGVSFPGGKLPEALLPQLERAMAAGMSLVNGLHEYLREKPRFRALAARHGVSLIDIRWPKPARAFRPWTGAVCDLPCTKWAVLGIDIIAGKRTSMHALAQAARARGVSVGMIYTGQTGWMQGIPHGFIFDATPNGHIAGEIEQAMLACYRDLQPRLMLLEGQAALQNPSGPCGAELLLSAALDGVILQHVPARTCFQVVPHLQIPLPPITHEIELIHAYGVPVLAVCLNPQGMEPSAIPAYQQELAQEIGLPVLLPLHEAGAFDALLEEQLGPIG